MLKQDYLLRQVESLAMSLSKLFFNKDMVQYKLEEKDNLSDTDILYKVCTTYLLNMVLT